MNPPKCRTERFWLAVEAWVSRHMVLALILVFLFSIGPLFLAATW